jgi:hypothetical protein
MRTADEIRSTRQTQGFCVENRAKQKPFFARGFLSVYQICPESRAVVTSERSELASAQLKLAS